MNRLVAPWRVGAGVLAGLLAGALLGVGASRLVQRLGRAAS